MTSIHAALVRLNVAAQKISFWEVQLENAIKHAEFLDDFNARQVSKEKQDAKSELTNFERSIRAGTSILLLQKRFVNLSKPTTEIINSQFAIRPALHSSTLAIQVTCKMQPQLRIRCVFVKSI